MYNDLDTDEMLGEEMLPDTDAVSVEDAAIAHILRKRLRGALALLPSSERKLIDDIYFRNLSERQVSEKTGVHYMTIHNRKVKVLKKLAKLMK